MQDVSIIISSCDRYSYLWDIQMQFFEKYWPNCPYPIHIISDTKTYDYNHPNLNITTLCFGPSNGPSDWSTNLYNTLTTIDSKYILYLQEDYILHKPVDQARIDSVLEFAQQKNINYLRFYTAPKGNGDVIQINKDLAVREIIPGSQWRNSLMLAIWNRETLKHTLEHNKNISPWEFETKVNFDAYDGFYCIELDDYDSSDVFCFYGMYGSSNGFTFYPFIVELLKKENIKKLNNEPIDYTIVL